MPYRVVIEDDAARQIRRLPKHVQQLVIAKIEALGHNPRPPGCEKLAGFEQLYRVRSGDYRIVYRVQDEVLLVVVVSVGHRSDVYERLKRKWRKKR